MTVTEVQGRWATKMAEAIAKEDEVACLDRKLELGVQALVADKSKILKLEAQATRLKQELRKLHGQVIKTLEGRVPIRLQSLPFSLTLLA